MSGVAICSMTWFDGMKLDDLAAHCRREGLDARREVSLAGLSTFRLGGPCALLIEAPEIDGVIKAASVLEEHSIPFLLMGGGSNVLISDEGYPGVILHHAGGAKGPCIEGSEVIVPAAYSLDQASLEFARKGWAGLSFATGIPGTVGGAVVGNAGAWGIQMADHLIGVKVWCPGSAVKMLAADSLGFSYRRSALQQQTNIVLEAKFPLKICDPLELFAEREEYLGQRAARHPDLNEWPSIGSIFRNIEPTSKVERRKAAGYFLEEAGAKTFVEGGARVFERHANIIVAGEGCRAADVYCLIARMRNAVKERYGFELEREVRFLGNFPGAPPFAGFW